MRSPPLSAPGAAASGPVALACAVIAVVAGPVSAQSDAGPVDLSSSLNIVGQATGERDVASEIFASLDVFTDVHIGDVTLHVYLEANSTPVDDGVSSRIPYVNMDAGTALGGNGRGRLQFSEVYLSVPVLEGGRWYAGLMDLTGFLDVSRIANDENLFFLGQPFVNNPTIVFPDYTLGTAIEVGIPTLPDGRLALTVSSSHGLADHPEASYDRLFDVTDDERGLFIAGRVQTEGERLRGSVGAWSSTGGRFEADPQRRPLPKRGVYTVLGWSSDPHAVDLRLGRAAGSGTSEPFIGVTYLGTIGSNAMGIGVARTPALPEVVGRTGQHAEAFVRRSIGGLLYLTTSVQWLSEALLLDAASTDGAWIFGFRVSAAF